jgi:hypothetical protein
MRIVRNITRLLNAQSTGMPAQEVTAGMPEARIVIALAAGVTMVQWSNREKMWTSAGRWRGGILYSVSVPISAPCDLCYRCIPKYWTHRRTTYACAQRPGLPQACLRVAAASSPTATYKQVAALTLPARRTSGCARPCLCHRSSNKIVRWIQR